MVLIWGRRFINESHSVLLGEQLKQVLPSPAIDRLIEDERSHVELIARFLAHLGAKPPEVPPFAAIPANEAPSLTRFRCVATGLAVCETVSAARFTAVRSYTDLPVPRACIEYFLRDEIAHSELGFLLLPQVLEAVSAEQLEAELSDTFRQLEHAIGLDAEPKKLQLQARPQPPQNAGIVEPAIDAIAFYDAIHRTILPRMKKLGINAPGIWRDRFDKN